MRNRHHLGRGHRRVVNVALCFERGSNKNKLMQRMKIRRISLFPFRSAHKTSTPLSRTRGCALFRDAGDSSSAHLRWAPGYARSE